MRLSSKNEEVFRDRMAELDAKHPASMERITGQAEERKAEIEARFQQDQKALDAEHDTAWSALESEWKTLIGTY